MNQEEYDTITSDLMTAAHQIETTKRPAYVRGSKDVLANFKRAGETAGTATSQAWLVHFLKHVDAIAAWARDERIPQAEEMRGRFADGINYLRLGWAIFNEAVPEPETTGEKE